jgi:hypothetical protein
LLSPIFGDFSDFPPAILRRAPAIFQRHSLGPPKAPPSRRGGRIQVFEGQSHAQFLLPFTPETEEAFGEIARFFETHLAA